MLFFSVVAHFPVTVRSKESTVLPEAWMESDARKALGAATINPVRGKHSIPDIQEDFRFGFREVGYEQNTAHSFDNNEAVGVAGQGPNADRRVKREFRKKFNEDDVSIRADRFGWEAERGIGFASELGTGGSDRERQ